MNTKNPAVPILCGDKSIDMGEVRLQWSQTRIVWYAVGVPGCLIKSGRNVEILCIVF